MADVTLAAGRLALAASEARAARNRVTGERRRHLDEAVLVLVDAEAATRRAVTLLEMAAGESAP